MSMNPTRQIPTYIDKKSNIVDVDAELKKIGDTNELEITDKSNIVIAINQIINSIRNPIVVEI